MTTLGGTIITHDCIKYDYCIKEAINSLIEICDEIIINDAESTDGTIELIKKMQINFPKIKLFHDKWEQRRDGKPAYDRLCVLADNASAALSTVS